jgi:hypothetical protein
MTCLVGAGLGQIRKDEHQCEHEEEHVCEEEHVHKEKPIHEDDEHLHHEGGVIEVSLHYQKMLGLKSGKVAFRHIKKSLLVTGEIGRDFEKLAHVTSDVPGHVIELKTHIGDHHIETGRSLALIKGRDGEIREIRAPAECLIMGRYVFEGEEVDTLTTLFTIADMSKMRASFDVHQKDIGFVRAGQKIRVQTLAYPGKTYSGKISFVSPIVDEKTRTIKVRADIDNYDCSLKLGMFVRGHITDEDSRKRLSISSSAIQRWEDEEIVCIPVGDNEYKVRRIEIGVRGEDFSEVISGLRAGETVVTEGSFHLKAEFQKALVGDHAGCSH